MNILNHNEISKVSNFDLDEDYGVDYFWNGIARWLNENVGTPWKSGQDMVNDPNGVLYACMEAGQHYGEIEKIFKPFPNQPKGITQAEWGSRQRPVAIVDGEVIGVDIELGEITEGGISKPVLKVMSPECVDYFIVLPNQIKTA